MSHIYDTSITWKGTLKILRPPGCLNNDDNVLFQGSLRTLPPKCYTALTVWSNVVNHVVIFDQT